MLRGSPKQNELWWDTPEKLKTPLKVETAGRAEKRSTGWKFYPKIPTLTPSSHWSEDRKFALWKLETLDLGTIRGSQASLKRWELTESWYPERQISPALSPLSSPNVAAKCASQCLKHSLWGRTCPREKRLEILTARSDPSKKKKSGSLANHLIMKTTVYF